jgi:hypothetical protein
LAAASHPIENYPSYNFERLFQTSIEKGTNPANDTSANSMAASGMEWFQPNFGGTLMTIQRQHNQIPTELGPTQLVAVSSLTFPRSFRAYASGTIKKAARFIETFGRHGEKTPLKGSEASLGVNANPKGRPNGPARTDCYLALSQFYRGQSDLDMPRLSPSGSTGWERRIERFDRR